jgi:hypothetical protein
VSGTLVSCLYPGESSELITNGLYIKSIKASSAIIIAGIRDILTDRGASDLDGEAINCSNTTPKSPTRGSRKQFTGFLEILPIFVLKTRRERKLEGRFNPVYGFIETLVKCGRRHTILHQ